MDINLKAKKSYNPSAAFMDMMGNEINGNIIQLPIELLTPYPDQKTFRKYNENMMNELSKDISKNGIISPVIVRPYQRDGKTLYQILAGHNRTNAAILAGLEKVPCILKDVDDNTAKIIFVTTNLNQRERLLPSEKAFAYKLLRETENSECQIGTADNIAQQGNESRRQIFRYLRLTYLIKPLLDMVDDEKIPFMAGVNLSYLNEKCQEMLCEYVSANELKIKLIHSELIKKLINNGEISCNQLEQVFFKKDKIINKKSLKLPINDIRNYFNEQDSEEQVINKIIEIVKEHFNNAQNNKN